mgnify:CR=1 FL=1
MRAISTIVCCTLLATTMVAGPAAAETLFDNTTAGLLPDTGQNCDAGTWLANNFTPAQQWDLDSVDIYGWYAGSIFGSDPEENEFWIELWSDSNGPDTELWALPSENRFALPEDGHGPVNVSVAGSFPTLAPDTAYWLVMGSDYGGFANGTWQLVDEDPGDGLFYNHPEGGSVTPYGWFETTGETAFRLNGESYSASPSAEDDSPEPCTWVLLAASGVIGGIIRRRRD